MKPRIKIKKDVKPSHLKVLAPIPSEAYDNPTEWASSHLEKQIPLAAKELEWQLKFGDSRTRREIAIETLGMKGISARGNNNTQVVPAIQLVMTGPLPWTQIVEPPPNKQLQPPPNREIVEGELVENKEGDKDA